MKIVTVDILEVGASEDYFGFALGWEDVSGKRGAFKITRDLIHGELRADSKQHISRELILSVLHALVENLELNDK
jgi:hypothetical protein